MQNRIVCRRKPPNVDHCVLCDAWVRRFDGILREFVCSVCRAERSPEQIAWAEQQLAKREPG